MIGNLCRKPDEVIIVGVVPVMFHEVFLCTSAFSGAVLPEAFVVTGTTQSRPLLGKWR